MIAVLADSCKVGRTSWVACRGLCSVVVAGILGDKISIHSIRDLNDGEESQIILEDGVYDLPEESMFVRVEHIETGEGRVYVDLR